MNAKLPLVLTTASVAALMGATANAAQVGNSMDYAQSIVISAPPSSPFLNGTGSGVGTGVFDSSGTLDVSSAVATSIFFGSVNGTVFASTTYQGSIAGTTWTFSGTTTNQITACTGSALLCSNAVPGPPASSTGNPIFTLDILTGGVWNTVSSLATATLTVEHTLTPVAAVPVPAAAWLFGSALLGLAGISRKRKA